MKRIRSDKILVMAVSMCMFLLIGCSNKAESDTVNDAAKPKPTHSPAVTVKKEEATPIPTVKEDKPVIKSIDLSREFKGINGCAVIYDPKINEYEVYNESMCKTEVSPYSTFKIVSTLIGLKN